jgi:hypothetical protein
LSQIKHIKLEDNDGTFVNLLVYEVYTGNIPKSVAMSYIENLSKEVKKVKLPNTKWIFTSIDEAGMRARGSNPPDVTEEEHLVADLRSLKLDLLEDNAK